MRSKWRTGVSEVMVLDSVGPILPLPDRDRGTFAFIVLTISTSSEAFES